VQTATGTPRSRTCRAPPARPERPRGRPSAARAGPPGFGRRRALVGESERLARIDRPPTQARVVLHQRAQHEELGSPGLARRLDSMRIRSPEPEPLVVARIALDQEHWLP